MIRARAHFGKSEGERLREWRLHQRQLEQTRRDHDKKKADAADELESDLVSAAMVVVTTEEIDAFTVRLDEFDARLDDYHEASVEALIEANAKLEIVNDKLDKTRERLDAMREKAFELEDGRRVFVSEDGTWSIDVTGNSVAIDEVPVDIIPNNARIADQYKASMEYEAELIGQQFAIEGEIEDIHHFDRLREEYEERADAIRGQLEKDGATKEQLDRYEDELDRMDAELTSAMPSSVRARVNGLSMETELPEMMSAFQNAAEHQTELHEPALASPSPEPEWRP